MMGRALQTQRRRVFGTTFMDGLRVLITNITLADRTGTETYVRDLALGLQRLGHTPMVYSTHHGQVSQELMHAAIPVVDHLEQLSVAPDVIHGHHHPETMTALLHFPTVPALFFCHDRFAWHDRPPRFPRILRYVAVDDNCLDRLLNEEHIPSEHTRVLLNAVDLERFRPRGPLPEKPGRALVFSHYAGNETHLQAVQEACRLADLPLDVIGSGVGASCQHPEELLGKYDLVFAKARCALEAAAVGAAVVLCDQRGAGPIVTTAELSSLRQLNFGMKTLTRPLRPELILEQINRYDAQDAMEVSRRIRATAGLDQLLSSLADLYRTVISEHRERAAPPWQAEQQALAQYLSAYAPFRLLRELHEARGLAHQERDHWRVQCEHAQMQAEVLKEQAQMQADHLVQQANLQADHLRQQAQTQFDELKEQAQIQAELLTQQLSAARAEAEGWRTQYEQRSEELRAVTSSTTMRIRDWLVGLPGMGQFLPKVVSSLMPRRNPC